MTKNTTKSKKPASNDTNPHPKSNKPKSKTHHCRLIKRNPMVGGFDDMVDGMASSAAWRGDQAMGCCGCGGLGSCGCVGGRQSESVGWVRVAWRDAST